MPEARRLPRHTPATREAVIIRQLCVQLIATLMTPAFTHINGVKFPGAMSPKMFRRAVQQIQVSHAIRKQTLRNYRNAIRANNAVQASEFADMLVGDTVCLTSYAISANAKLPLKFRRSLDECFQIGGNLSASSPLKETVAVWSVPKKDGGSRILMRFDLQHKALQLASRDLINSHVAFRKFQFDLQGHQAAVQAVRNHLALGYTHHAHLDIARFYPSFEATLLKENLPLPTELVDHVLTGRHLNLTINERSNGKQAYPPYKSHNTDSGPNHNNIIKEARLGAPAGSISSPMIGSWSTSHLSAPSGDRPLTTYVDNALLLAYSAEEAEAAASELIQSVSKLPGGHFELKWKSSGPTNETFSYLGHEFRRSPEGVTVKPSEAALGHLNNKFGELDYALAALSNAHLPSWKRRERATLELGRMWLLISGWAASFKKCDDVERYIGEYRIYYGDWLKTFNLSHAKIATTSETIEYPLGLDYDLEITAY